MAEEYVGAFDPGYGEGKLALNGPDGVTTATVPSIVGMGHTDIGRLSLGDVGRQRRRSLPDRVVFDGVSYLVGEGAGRYADPMDEMDFLRLRKGPAVRGLFYDVLHRGLGEGHHQVSLLVGLPVEVMADDGAADATLRCLEDWMIGVHEFGVNDQQVTVRVKDVAVLAQPVGSFFAWGFNDAGAWTRSRSDLNASIGILDMTPLKKGRFWKTAAAQ